MATVFIHCIYSLHLVTGVIHGVYKKLVSMATVFIRGIYSLYFFTVFIHWGHSRSFHGNCSYSRSSQKVSFHGNCIYSLYLFAGVIHGVNKKLVSMTAVVINCIYSLFLFTEFTKS